MFSEHNVIYALILTLLAGLATIIGSIVTLFVKRTNTSLLSFGLGLSAGVMIYVSFIDIFPKANELLSVIYGEKLGLTYTTLAFFGGMLLIALIDKLIPEVNNPHELKNISLSDRSNNSQSSQQKLMRMGLMTALFIGIHNFPEGIATFMAVLEDPQIGVAIVIAIAIHNIPEGIAVAIPIFIATGSKQKAFFMSFLSGLAEPVGALIGYMVLMPYLSSTVLAIVFASVAGIMIYISIDELLPAAREWGKNHTSIYGLIVGMAVMSIAIIVLM